MAEKKRQDFVPQFYLRNFSHDDININIFVKSTNDNHFGSIKKQCSKSYFYGTGGEVENLLSDLETKHSIIINHILDNQNLSINELEYIEILRFVEVMYARNQRIAEKMQLNVDQYFEKIIKPYMFNTPKFLKSGYSPDMFDGLKLVLRDPIIKVTLDAMIIGSYLLSDLMPSILINENADYEFITSDNPIIYYNTALNEIKDANFSATMSPGLQIFVPLSPKICLLLFDLKFYEIVKNDNVDIMFEGIKYYKIKINDKEDVLSINKLHFYNSSSTIYYDNDNQLEYIKKICESIECIPSKPPVILKEINVKNLPSSQKTLIITEEQIPYKLALSFVNVLPLPNRLKLYRHEKQVDFHDKYREFLEKVERRKRNKSKVKLYFWNIISFVRKLLGKGNGGR